MLKSVYDPNLDGVIALAQTEADMKRSVYDANLDGVIAIAQTEADMTKAVYDTVIDALIALAADHNAQHEDGGTDEISAAGLVGRINYVDRGDPANADKTVGDFTCNGAWHDLDLSTPVPAGAIAIYFRCFMTDNNTDTKIRFRKKGNSNEMAIVQQRTQVSNIGRDVTALCPCDANRVIQYLTTNTVVNNITLTVLGWMI